MRKLAMVVTDLDGTLLRDDKTVSAYTAMVFRRLRAQGVRLVIATARPQRSVAQLAPHIPFYDAGVFHNGAEVVERGARIGGRGIDRPRAWVRRLLAEDARRHVAVESGEQLYANFDAGEIWPGVVFVRTASFREIPPGPAHKIVLRADTSAQLEAYRALLTDDLYLEWSERMLAMIMHRDATKFDAVRLLASRYGIALSDVAAFGDDCNDMGMLRGCGVGVAVGNALSEVKEAADEVCDSNERDGVARWLASALALEG